MIGTAQFLCLHFRFTQKVLGVIRDWKKKSQLNFNIFKNIQDRFKMRKKVSTGDLTA